MAESRIGRVEKAGHIVGIAVRRPVPDATADDEIGCGVGVNRLPEMMEMMGPPDVVVADIANPFSAGAADALIVGRALASARSGFRLRPCLRSSGLSKAYDPFGSRRCKRRR